MILLFLPVVHYIDYDNVSAFDRELSAGITRHYMLFYKGIESNGFDSKCFSNLNSSYLSDTNPSLRQLDSFVYIYNTSNIIELFSNYINALNQILLHKTIIIIDPLQLKTSVSVYFFALLLRRKRVVFITDSPVFSFEKSPFRRKLSEFLIRYSNGAIVVNNQLKDLLNSNTTESIVIESFVDESKYITPNFYLDNNQLTLNVLYSGEIAPQNGISNLLLAAKKLTHINFKLCGPVNIDYEEEFISLCKSKNIEYLGIIDYNSLLVEFSNASLLINPRTNSHEYTKYSLPIKIPTYLSSGVPVMTTLLSGIPRVYNEYMLTLQSNSVEEIQDAILNFFALSIKERIEIGMKARFFIINRLSYKLQGKKISEWLKQL